MSSDSSHYPSLSELRLDTFGSWTGEAALTPEHRISVMYVNSPRAVSLLEVKAAVRETVERVFQNEWGYRLAAARAWLEEFHRECTSTRGWDDEQLARSLVLRGLILGGSDSTVILEHAVPTLAYLIDKELKTWFNADGSLSHISGSLY